MNPTPNPTPRIAIILFCLLVGAACSIKHPIVKDYPGYLEKHAREGLAPALSPRIGFELTDRTRDHHLEFRWASAGAIHLWMVDFGQMLDLTLRSPDYANAFEPRDSDSAIAVTFDLLDYRFKNFQAYVDLAVDVVQDDQVLMTRNYSVIGRNQAGKVMVAGVFGATNAITVSTKDAIDQIMRQLRADLEANGLTREMTKTRTMNVSP